MGARSASATGASRMNRWQAGTHLVACLHARAGCAEALDAPEAVDPELQQVVHAVVKGAAEDEVVRPLLAV